MLHQAGKAAFDEYERVERPHAPMQWFELDDASKANWVGIAREVLIVVNSWPR